MGRQMYMIRKIRSGNIIEEISFPVSPNTKPRAPRRRGATASLPRKQDANERATVKRLNRLIHCNFAPGDLLIGPDYSEESLRRLMDGLDPDDMEGLRTRAEHDLRLFLRRLSRALERAGVDLRYIALTSDMDGDTGELVRVHHHVILGAEGITMQDGELYVGKRRLSEIWGHGHVDYRPLAHQDDYSRLAAYLMRQVRRVPDGRKYSASRNLKHPVLVSERIVYVSRELRVPRGARLLHRDQYTPGEVQYIRYTAPVREAGRRRE